MTLRDLPEQKPRLVCGITPQTWGQHPPLACILDMNHAGRVHQDRMGRTWELLAEFTPRTHHVDIVQRLLVLEEGTLQLLDRIAGEIHDPDGVMNLVEVARFERRRVHDTLVAMGLADEDPKPAPAELDACPRCFCRPGRGCECDMTIPDGAA
jgi:hypothetical protein